MGSSLDWSPADWNKITFNRRGDVHEGSYLEVEETFFHFALIGDHLLVMNSRWSSKLSHVRCWKCCDDNWRTLTFPCLSKLNSAKLHT